MTRFTTRPLTQGDLPFLHSMLREASCWDEEPQRTSVADVMADPNLTRYVEAWGRPGDAGLIAESDVGECLGAAWFRLFEPGDRGFGFVAGDIPELGIATVPQSRGVGVGGALLRALIEVARSDGHPKLSLSVDDGNARAMRLYRSVGFSELERVEGSWTMLLQLSPRR